jgi:hypothetical protein
MAPRSRDNLPDDESSGLYRDEPDAETNTPASEETVRDDTLSFLAIDGDEEDGSGGDELTPYQQKHSLLRYIPPRALRAWKATVKWAKGPQPPRPWKITPLFEPIQTAPIRLLDTLCPKSIYRFWLLVAFLSCWALVFSLVLWKSAFAADVPGYGSPTHIGCGARFWYIGLHLPCLPSLNLIWYGGINRAYYTGSKATPAASTATNAAPSQTAHSPSTVPPAAPITRSSSPTPSERKKSTTDPWSSAAPQGTPPMARIPFTEAIVLYAVLQCIRAILAIDKAAAAWSS